MRILFFILILLVFLSSSVYAVSFSISPTSSDAGINVRFSFNFLSDTGYRVHTISIYVPPCDDGGCPGVPYYDVDNNTISSSPAATYTITGTYGGKISNITWVWLSPPESVFLFFNTTTDAPTQDRADEWESFYAERKMGSITSGTISNYSSVLVPNLQIVEFKVIPKEVLLNSNNPQTTVYVNATIKNVKDSTHSGSSYGVNPIMAVSPAWSPTPSPSPYSTNLSLGKLLPDQAVLAQWVLTAKYGETNTLHDIGISASDRNGYSSNTLSDKVNVTTIIEAPITCTKCYIKSLTCPALPVTAGSNFDINYEINATNRSYEIQTILMDDTVKACYYTENYDACSIIARTRTVTAPSTTGVYSLKVTCYASDSGDVSYCSYADDYKTCSISVTGIQIPTSLQLGIISPQENQVFIKGNSLLLKARLTYQNGSIATGATVKATSSFFDMQLFDDGKNSDDAPNDGIYAISFPIAGTVPPATYSIKFLATKNSYSVEKNLNIQVVSSSLSVVLQTDKSEYAKGENIKITGSVSDVNGNAIANVTVIIGLGSGSWRFKYKIFTDSSGKFSYEYPISFGDPDGKWNIFANATDGFGNDGANQIFVTVKISISNYYLRFINPVKDSTYKRGENMTIEVEVTRAEKSVSNATVTCRNPTTSIKLEEIAPGIYSQGYQLGFEEPLGVWGISCQAIREEEGKVLAGGAFISIVIGSAEIKIGLMHPTTDVLTSGETVIFMVNATYPNNRFVRAASMILNFQEESVFLGETREGVYSGAHKVRDQGQFIATIQAKDLNGNEGKIEKTFIVKFSWFYFILGYWWLPLLGWIPVLPFVFKRLKEKLPEEQKIVKEIEKHKKELKQLEEMQRATQQEYFQRKIDEKTFKNMTEDFEKKTIEFQVRIRNLEVELERIKIKKRK